MTRPRGMKKSASPLALVGVSRLPACGLKFEVCCWWGTLRAKVSDVNAVWPFYRTHPLKDYSRYQNVTKYVP